MGQFQIWNSCPFRKECRNLFLLMVVELWLLLKRQPLRDWNHNPPSSSKLILRKKEKKILKGSHKAAPMKSHINTPEHFEQGVQENVNYRSYYSSLLRTSKLLATFWTVFLSFWTNNENVFPPPVFLNRVCESVGRVIKEEIGSLKCLKNLVKIFYFLIFE